MGSYLIKPELDTDLYVWWSTIVDGPIMWGTKKDFKKKYKKRKWMFRFGEDFKEKMKRADETHFSTRFHIDEDDIRWSGYVGEGDTLGLASIKLENMIPALKAWEEDLSMEPDDPRLLPFLDIEPLED